MFTIPQAYLMNTIITPKQFISRDIKKPEKERLRETLLTARLVLQIAGEEIPSLIDENYNCSVIMGLDVQLKSVKDAAFVADIVQREVKAPCVLRLCDNADEVYSFAHKRLNLTDKAQIVVEGKVQTPPLSLTFPDKTAVKLRQYLSFGKLQNKSDKLSLYLEATVKAFIISNASLYNGVDALLDRKLWYNLTEILALFAKLQELMRLNTALKAEKLSGEKAKLITTIKTLIALIKGE